MNLTTAIYKYSLLYFIAFVVLVVWGFWASYYSNPLEMSPPRIDPSLVHLHSAVMTAWCLMLITQAFLIRTGGRSLHRIVGRSSYVLAPAIVVIGVIVTRDSLAVREAEMLMPGIVSDGGAIRVAMFFVGQAVFFAVLYGLAILYRKDSAMHARFMLTTAFPLLPPATDRIIPQYFEEILLYLPEHEKSASLVTYALTDGVLLLLSVWDWKSPPRRIVFPVVLAVMIVYQVFSMAAHRLPAWKQFSAWFLGVG